MDRGLYIAACVYKVDKADGALVSRQGSTLCGDSRNADHFPDARL